MSSREPHSLERVRRQYTFGDFTLDAQRRGLQRGGEEITLRAKSMDVLAYLVEHHGKLVTKAELMEAVWPDTAVTDNSLAQCLVEIRRALDDDSQQLIRTVARRGYVFEAPVAPPIVGFPRPQPAAPRRKAPRAAHMVAVAAAVLAIGVAIVASRIAPPKRESSYTQITSFTDSVVSPALSPDGRMVAFIRSDEWFLTPDQIYVKLLPNGDPVQITRDSRNKYGLAFSPDGSRIAYTVGTGPGWNTYTVSPLGGEPKLLLANAAGLTWLDERGVLFSEIRTGIHMGLVTALDNRSEHRRVYFPRDERGMVHLAYASPNRKWALLIEMDPVWQPCRVVPLDGSSSGRQVGPRGKCTSAAWSPDGRWMYFSVEVEGQRHLWRQRFLGGEPEQITSGPTDEEGIAVAPDGRSLITSIGMRQSAVWIRDARGERAVSSEGYVPTTGQSGLFGAAPRFSRDGASLFYLRRVSPEAPIELWRTDLASGKTDKIVPGFSILEYDISDSGSEVVFSTRPAGKPAELWLVVVDRSVPPRMIASSGETSPHFGPGGQIVFRMSDGTTHRLARMERDGSGRSTVASYPIGNIQAISPDRRWIVSIMPVPQGHTGASMAVPLDGGPPRRICAGGCPVRWSPDMRYLYISVSRGSSTTPGKTVVLPVSTGETFPDLPASGIRDLSEAAASPGSRVIDGYGVVPGPDPSVLAFVKATVHRNLYRVPLP